MFELCYTYLYCLFTTYTEYGGSVIRSAGTESNAQAPMEESKELGMNGAIRLFHHYSIIFGHVLVVLMYPDRSETTISFILFIIGILLRMGVVSPGSTERFSARLCQRGSTVDGFLLAAPASFTA